MMPVFIIFSTCRFVQQGLGALLRYIGVGNTVTVDTLAGLLRYLVHHRQSVHVLMVLQGHQEIREAIQILANQRHLFSLSRWSVLMDTQLPGELCGVGQLSLNGVIDLAQPLTYLMKDLQRTCQGERCISPRFRETAPLKRLTPSELMVYRHWMTNVPMAETAVVVQRTVKSISLSRSQIMRKLRAYRLHELLTIQALFDANSVDLFSEVALAHGLVMPELIQLSRGI